MTRFLPKKAFTLIELLIVVAIIAILAAIAVPNFLEAQTRSKVSRAVADMRTVATALETYYVDNNHYPWTYNNVADDLDGYGNFRRSDTLTVPNSITTPIAYLTSHVVDPFKIGRRINGPGYQGTSSFEQPYQSGDARDMTFVYLNMDQAYFGGNPSAFGFFATVASWEYHLGVWGRWQMRSMGPSGLYPGTPLGTYPGATFNSINSIYDPTNGTLSLGMVIRNQRSATGEQRSASE